MNQQDLLELLASSWILSCQSSMHTAGALHPG